MQNLADRHEIPLSELPLLPRLGVGKMAHSSRVVYVNRSAELAALMPPGVVTVTSTVPVPGGETAVIEVGE
jgi:hypothetical protein